MKKIAISISIIVLLLIVAICGLVYSYTKTPDYKEVILPESTTINGIDCSDLTYEEAEKKLSEEWNKKHIVITGNLNNKLTSFTDFGYEYDLMPQLKNIKKSNIFAAAMNHYINAPFNVSMTMKTASYDEEFKNQVINSSCFKVKDAVPSQDAYVDMSKPDFPIVPEIFGTEPDTEKLFEEITHSIEMGKMNFIFDEKAYLSAPSVTANDPELLAYQEYCRKYLKQKITYKLGEETFTIPAKQLATLMNEDMSGNADPAAVEKYVAALASEYDNVGAQRNFVNLAGKEVSVSGGTYGWQIDQSAEAAQLTADINSHKDVSREPKFSVTGYGEYSRAMGDTYIDVDITQQKVRSYKNGQLVWSSDCVSGNKAAGRLTDIGTYYIINKVRNVVLRGYNNDGSEYASPVQYWMAINWNGEGFHDSNWRVNFGGNIWRTNGSHGCVNIPRQNMPEFYNMTELGTPIVIHY